jgi:tetratricopeptide (TPR) repeat protein
MLAAFSLQGDGIIIMAHMSLKVILLCFVSSSCFKRAAPNEFALLHQKACVESMELKDHVRAQTHCELCLEYDKTMPECLNGIGLIALINNDEDKAKNYFTKALRQNNDFSQARSNLGVIYFSRGDFQNALKYFDRALEIDPSNIDARYNSGLSHFRLAVRMKALLDKKNSMHHLVIAKDQMRKLVAIEPTYHTAYHDLGLIDLSIYEQIEFAERRRELLSSAKAQFQRCLEANKEEDGCYEGLGQCFMEEGHFDQAFANYFLCLNFAPDNSACRANIVVAYEKSAQADGGFNGFMKTVAAQKDNALAHEAFCGALFEKGLDEQAVKECQIALRIKPDLCSAHYHLANYYAQVLHAESAVQHCQSFLLCERKTATTKTARCQEILTTVRR